MRTLLAALLLTASLAHAKDKSLNDEAKAFCSAAEVVSKKKGVDGKPLQHLAVEYMRTEPGPAGQKLMQSLERVPAKEFYAAWQAELAKGGVKADCPALKAALER
ncbi:MAG: hypothetical protein QM723_16860 [Myxococcaceae bacterium]